MTADNASPTLYIFSFPNVTSPLTASLSSDVNQDQKKKFLHFYIYSNGHNLRVDTKGIYKRLAQIIHPKSYLSTLSLPCQLYFASDLTDSITYSVSMPGGYAC